MDNASKGQSPSRWLVEPIDESCERRQHIPYSAVDHTRSDRIVGDLVALGRCLDWFLSVGTFVDCPVEFPFASADMPEVALVDSLVHMDSAVP